MEDDFVFETQLAVDGTYTCSVSTVTEAPGSITADLFCIQGDVAFEASITAELDPAPTVPFPLQEADDVTIDVYSEKDFPGEGVIVRRAGDGTLLLAWVFGFDIDPPSAPSGWSAPATLTWVEGLCAPDDDNSERRAIDIETDTAGPLRVFSEHVGTLDAAEATFELRVDYTAYNPDIGGGCNTCFDYALLAAPLLAEK